jgi:hypothetical protein
LANLHCRLTEDDISIMETDDFIQR